jgi:hypothetical protein
MCAATTSPQAGLDVPGSELQLIFLVPGSNPSGLVHLIAALLELLQALAHHFALM